MGAESQEIVVAAGQALIGNNGWLTGYDIGETSGSAKASVQVYSGVGVNAANLIAEIDIVAGDSKDVEFPDGDWRRFNNGFFVVITGAVRGVFNYTYT